MCDAWGNYLYAYTMLNGRYSKGLDYGHLIEYMSNCLVDALKLLPQKDMYLLYHHGKFVGDLRSNAILTCDPIPSPSFVEVFDQVYGVGSGKPITQPVIEAGHEFRYKCPGFEFTVMINGDARLEDWVIKFAEDAFNVIKSKVI